MAMTVELAVLKCSQYWCEMGGSGMCIGSAGLEHSGRPFKLNNVTGLHVFICAES